MSQIGKSLSLLTTLFRKTGRADVGLIGAGVAFYGMMAVFPAITAFVTLWGFFADPILVEQQLATLEPVVPEDAYDMIQGQVQSITLANVSLV